MRVRKFLPHLAVSIFYLIFFLNYQYRYLLDDPWYQAILNHHYFIPASGAEALLRPLHHGLLYLQGYVFNSMKASVGISILIHLSIGWIVWKYLVPSLDHEKRRYAHLALIAFLFHPVALHTTVHVAQRAEILSAFFLVISLVAFLNIKPKNPDKKRWILFIITCICAFLSKENAILIPLVLTYAIWKESKKKPAFILLVAFLSLSILTTQLNSFATQSVQNSENFRKTEAYFSTIREGKIISASDSILFTTRTPITNLALQIALLPKIVRILFFPFHLVKDYGPIPFGIENQSFTLFSFWLGILLVLVTSYFIYYFCTQLRHKQLALILCPLALYSVYWIFPVYDPLVLYRLYGFTLFVFVCVLPEILKRIRFSYIIALSLAGTCTFAGIVRAFEIYDPVQESALDLQRIPTNYRVYLTHMHALMDAKTQPVNCQEELEPGLKYSSSTSFIYIEWAWCLNMQGDKDKASHYALKSLEQVMVKDRIPFALSLLTPTDKQVLFLNIHPENKWFIETYLK